MTRMITVIQLTTTVLRAKRTHATAMGRQLLRAVREIHGELEHLLAQKNAILQTISERSASKRAASDLLDPLLQYRKRAS